MSNNTQSFEYIYKAAENGDAEMYRSLAEQGSAWAQYRMGLIYSKGKGVPQDFAKALKWYHKAAAQGDADAQFNIGSMYDEGKGVQQAYVETVKWYRMAAEQGHVKAQYKLGRMYYEDRGVPQDYSEAAKWFNKAAKQGNAGAQIMLGLMYFSGEGVQQDYAEAAKWVRMAAEQGSAWAQYKLGWMYYDGKGVPQNDAEAVKCFRMAAAQGDADAQFNIGVMYNNGEGVQQDYAEAAKWVRMAAEQGDAKAQIELDKMKEEVAELDMHMGSSDVSLNELIGEDGGENQEEPLIKSEERNNITVALTSLSKIEKYIILNRVMADNPKTMQAIGYKYNITQEEARQIEKQALKKMQQVLRHGVVTSVGRRFDITEKHLAESLIKKENTLSSQGYTRLLIKQVDKDGQILDSFCVTMPLTSTMNSDMHLMRKEHTCPIMGAKFVLIPAGTFMMGSPDDEIGRMDYETLHQVTISKHFYLQITPVTQRQWEVVMGNNPSHFKGENLPVEMVSWEDVQEYIQKLNERAGDARYRLPTEAEWEYACRAGSNGRYCFGDDETMLSEYAWYKTNSSQETHPVGLKRPNAWGIYDMTGNVREWCHWYGGNTTHNVTDPAGPASGEWRMLRGGSWDDNAQNSRAAAWSRLDPDFGDFRDSRLGFRVAVSSR